MTRYDAVIVGAGHNGLVAACYLARAGLRVVMVERRSVLGGAAVTEEILPGFKMSTASYSFSLFRPDIFSDFDLARHGLALYPKDPQLFMPLPGGTHFFVWRDSDRTRAEFAKISSHDADSYANWNAFWSEAVSLLRPLVDDPDPPRLEEVEAWLASLGREDIWRLAIAGSAADTVSHFFESEEIRGAFVGQGIIGTASSPRDPGTAWVMTYHFIGGELVGSDGTWAYVAGGMGSVTAALAAVAREYGVEIRLDSEASEIVLEADYPRGVRLVDGEFIESRVVLSNADPHRTAALAGNSIGDEFIRRLETWRTDGAVIKVNMALGELPSFTTLPGTEPGPQHCGTIEICPSIDYLDRAYAQANSGVPSSEPFMEVFIASAVDPTLAPAGRHVLSAFAQYAPVGTEARSWEAVREEAGRKVIDVIASRAPNVPDAILGYQVLGPRDLEERFGLTGGDIFHGSILPEQSFGNRFEYRTGAPGLYLCGSGARPGGGVMGAAGRNCAGVVLQDLGGET